MSWLQCHKVHDPLLAFEFEIHTVDDEGVWFLRKPWCWRSHIRPKRLGKPSSNAHRLQSMEVPLLLRECVSIDEYSLEQRFGVSRTFSTKFLFPNSPGALAMNTLSSPLAETPHQSAATGRFRVYRCHTRELCTKLTKISRHCETKWKQYQPN